MNEREKKEARHRSFQYVSNDRKNNPHEQNKLTPEQYNTFLRIMSQEKKK